MRWDPIWAPVLIPAARLPIQLPACGLGKQWRMAQSLGTLHPCGRPGRGSWLQIGVASDVALTWGVNHRTEDLPLCLSSLYIYLSNKNQKKKKRIYFIRWSAPYVATMPRASPVWSQKSRISCRSAHRSKVSRFWALLNSFLWLQAGSWIGSRADGIRTGAHTGCRPVQGNAYTTRLLPQNHF